MLEGGRAASTSGRSPTSMRRSDGDDRRSLRINWCRGELNCRHHDFQSCALPTELPRHGGGATANWQLYYAPRLSRPGPRPDRDDSDGDTSECTRCRFAKTRSARAGTTTPCAARLARTTAAANDCACPDGNEYDGRYCRRWSRLARRRTDAPSTIGFYAVDTICEMQREDDLPRDRRRRGSQAAITTAMTSQNAPAPPMALSVHITQSSQCSQTGHRATGVLLQQQRHSGGEVRGVD